MRLSLPASLRLLLSVLLASEPLFAAGAPGASRFKAAYDKAVADSAKTFVSAAEVDSEGAVSALGPLAESEADKAQVEKFKALLKEVSALREPVAAKAGPAPDGQEPDILDARYKGKLMALAAKLGADGRQAAEVRRDLLRKAPPVGADGKPAANAQPPTPEERAAIRRMEARAGRAANAGAVGSARRTAAAMERFVEDGRPPVGAAPQAAPRAAADNTATELIGVANEAFKGGPHTLTTHAPQTPGGAHPPAPAEKGWWSRFRDATTIDSVQHAFEKHNREGMAVAAATEDRAAAQFANGQWVRGSANATLAWGQRLWAGDAQTVKQAAVGAAVVVAAVVAAPVVIAAGTAVATGGTLAAAGVTGMTVASTTLSAGLYGLTAYNVVNGTGHLAHKPDLVNATLLAANAFAIPGIGKASEFIVGKAAHLATSGGTAAVETTGAVTLAAVTPELAVAGGTAARATASGVAATGTAVESAASQVATQVAVRAAPAGEQLAVRAVEGVTENVVHASVHSAASVDPKH
ncbi:hypothetical protein EPO15_01365 [bacterium]|nr:MAG: hypothetical protein EPO15_01365 [bacterium]